MSHDLFEAATAAMARAHAPYSRFPAPCERFGVDFGMNVTEILVEDPGGLPKELMFIPALLTIGGIYLLQRQPTPAAGQTREA